jgi:photosystem II stability/assembly factor-like uncharacterized protein
VAGRDPGPAQVWLAAAFYSDVRFSTDGGATWTSPAGLPPLSDILGVMHDGGNPRTVYMLALLSEGAQLFRSTDGGQSFTGLATFPAPAPANGFVGVALWTSRTASGPLYVMLENGQLLVSTDQGATFTQRAMAGDGSSNMAVLGGSEAGAPTLYAILGNTFHNWKLFASEDAGKTWQERFDLGSDIFFSGGSGIGTSMTDPQKVLFGGIFAYLSTNGGRTFKTLPFDYFDHPQSQLHVDIDGIQMAKWQGRETLFIDTDGGTFMSADGGKTFENITLQNFPDAQYYATFTSPQNPDLVVAGSQDQGFQLSQPAPGLMSFTQIFAGDAGGLTSSSGTFADVFLGTPFAVALLPDPLNGLANIFSASLPPLTGRSFIPCMLADPQDSKSVYLAGDHIWYFQHFDQQPPPAPVQRPQDFSAGGTDYITALTISHADQGTWYAATHEGALWSSHDHGSTWASVRLQGISLLSVLASAQDPQTAYAGGFDANFVGAVYMTSDGGATWNALPSGLPLGEVNALGFDNAQNLYVASDGGPFTYDSAAGTWVNLVGAGNGAPVTRYTAIESLPTAGIVRFATFGRGIWDYDPTGSSQPPPPPPPGKCTPSAYTLCLVGGRFQVEATWQNQYDGTGGKALAVPRTDESGFLGFTDTANVELLVKVLALGGRYKVFYGELTTLEFTLTITDVLTGTAKTYKNTPGDCGAIDDTGFPEASRPASAVAAAAPAPVMVESALPAEPATARPPAAGACRPSSNTLCLMERRFALSMQWSNPGNATSGQGGAVTLGSDVSGAFYFTDPADLELVVKMLVLNEHIAVFYGTLSNLAYTLTITDTRSGQVKSYHNPAGTYCGGFDDTAFAP